MKTLKQVWTWLKEEEEFPDVQEEFSIQKLKELNDFESIQKYLLSCFGEPDFKGIGRDVWLLDSQMVLKLVGHPDSNQNRNEVKSMMCLGSKYAPKILDHHPDFLWVIQERLFQIDKQDLSDKLLELLGYRFVGWIQMRNFFHYSVLRMNSHEESDDSWGLEAFENPHQIEWAEKLFTRLYGQNTWFTALIDRLASCRVDASDFHDQNWGIRPSTGELVLLDLGF